MDQLKDFLRQCVKYRFWIAFGVSLLLPMIGYFVGVGPIVEATNKREGEIKAAKGDIGKYTSPGIVNGQYQPIVAAKKEALTKDVDATWRKLFTLQEPLLKWPEVVEERFRKWGRKYPSDVDRLKVSATIVDYTIAYPGFITRVYKTFKPFNFEDGTGIVVAPDEAALIKPDPTFLPDTPPDFSKVRAEQERLWVVTALLDVVAKVNDGAGAKDWDGAIIKQINELVVGSPIAQDQKSLAKGETLAPADPLLPEGAAAPPPPPTTPAPGGPETAGMPAMGAGATKSEGVYYLKTEGQLQYKILPVMMKVLVDQAKLPDFLVGLENSPMTIQVMEPEISKPLVAVVKPVKYADKSTFGMGGMGGMGGGEYGMTMPNMYNPMMMNRNNSAGPNMSSRGMDVSSYMMGGSGKAAAAPKKGTDIRGVNKAEERKANIAKDAAKPKAEPKAKLDQYYNVIEVTVYGQARFYLAPPPPPEVPPSVATTPAVPEPAPKPEDAAKKDEPAKAEDAAKKDEAPKAESPKAEAPKADVPAPEAPKGDAPKADAPKPDAPKADAPKADAPTPKS